MIQINTDNSIRLDGVTTIFSIGQRREGTVIYTAGHGGLNYREHPMPHARYSAAHDKPASGAAGRTQLEADIRALIDAQK